MPNPDMHIWAFADATGAVEFDWGKNEVEALVVFGRPAVASVGPLSWRKAPFPCRHARIADGRVVEMTATEKERVDAPALAREKRRDLRTLAGERLERQAMGEAVTEIDGRIAVAVTEIKRLEALAVRVSE